jgi:hypothetical protein
MATSPPQAGASTSFITYDPSTRKVSWSTSNPAQKVGNYMITITGTIGTYSDSLVFYLAVCTNACECSSENFSTSPSSMSN